MNINTMKSYLVALCGTLSFGVAFAAPPNDSFSSPVIVNGTPATLSGSNVDATLEAGEPTPMSPAKASVWFEWEAAQDGPIQIDTIGSNFDTILAVWDGTSFGNLNLVEQNDDSSGLQSRVNITATAGTTYKIAVYGFSGSMGAITLHIAAVETGGISGRVTGPDGTTPLQGINVSAWESAGFSWRDVEGTYTDVNGEYSFTSLPTGSYRIRFEDASGDHAEEHYPDAPDLESAQDVVVVAGGTVSGIDASLSAAARISGTVTGPDGTSPLQGINVYAHRWNGNDWAVITVQATDVDGKYTLGGLSTGTYRVRFYDWSGEHLGEAYDDVRDVELGNDIIATAGATVTGIDATLALASKITGVVTGPDGSTPLDGIFVYVVQWDSNRGWWEGMGGNYTDAAGNFEIGSLAPGTYRVEFWDDSGTYLTEVYDDAATLDEGQDIVVGANATVSGINASLSLPSTISGTVLQDDGVTPIVNARIYARDYASGNDTTDAAARTDTNGFYRIEGLRAGTYHVRTDFFGSPFLQEWYSDVLRHPDEMTPPTSATPVVVAASADVTDIDFQLSFGGELTGTLTGTSGLEVLNGSVLLVGITNGVEYSVAAESNGTYLVNGIFPDAYQVQAQAPQFKDEWFENSSVSSSSTPVAFAAGQQRQIDFELEPGQSPGIVNVTSDPPGAEIYLDFLPTGLLTPSFVDIGEVGAASRPVRLNSSDPLEPEIAISAATVLPHTISVKRPGSPLPPPEETYGEEGAVEIAHFDMTSSETASLQVVTTPAGASVYLNSADSPIGVSPLSVNNLLPGSHTLLLAREAHLLPRPVRVSIATNTLTVTVNIPLTLIASTNAPSALIDTTPDGALVFLNHLSPPFSSDFETELLDPASHAGAGWHSTEHVALVRMPGYLAASPRAILTTTNGYESVTVIAVDRVVASADADQDGLPDELEAVYDLDAQAPGESGPDDDPDQDGATNEEELMAGTNPLSADSLFATNADTKADRAEGEFRYVFSTVPFHRYVVQASNDLSDPLSWSNVSEVIIAPSTRMEYVSPVAPGGRFFRAVHISD